MTNNSTQFFSANDPAIKDDKTAMLSVEDEIFLDCLSEELNKKLMNPSEDSISLILNYSRLFS